ncbi:MAG: SDR family oxidoreductase [Planctomycetota bacterium]
MDPARRLLPADPYPAPGVGADPIVVTGATGYIGGRLVPLLLEQGYSVRCIVRDPRKIQHRKWSTHPRLEVVVGALEDRGVLDRACNGARALYYLVHSMIVVGTKYREHDRELAANVAAAAAAARLQQIIYLGGLGETGAGLSEHLSSRREVESVLASGGTPVTTLRAAMIIGSGSASFEILRYLVERLPIMVTPRWVSTRCQPIAVRNVLHYLTACLHHDATRGRTLDIGGPDVLTYRELMQVMAEERGLPRRWILPLPVLTPRLSSLWIHLVTPLHQRIARPLAEGLRNEVICRDDQASQLIPQALLSVRAAIAAALGKRERNLVETVWSAAGVVPGDPDWAGGTIFEDRWEVDVRASADAVYRAVCRIGGGHGWYAADWLWRLRGWMDRAVGGPGLRRDRRDTETVAYGDALGFWRVTEVAPQRRLALRAEMKLPGEALLQFDVESDPSRPRECRLVQTARFRPRGLFGLVYWYAVLPLHGYVFRGMLDGIRRAAEATEPATDGPRMPVRRVGRAPGEGRTHEPVE